ncbi:MAG: hypothetical protein H7145_15620 [Akkermansiaceae bacterium]|nr:hypothetical protein [Armatimonadota bacterium]
MRFRLLSALTFFLILGVSGTANAVTINAYLSAPDAQFAPSGFTGTTVETFNSLATGNRVTDYIVPNFGTYSLNSTRRLAVLQDNQYGNGTENYVSLGAQSGSSSPVTLTFLTPVRYFAFAYQAGDNNNGITFFNGNDMIGRFSTASILSLLGNRVTGSVQAVNGTIYQSSAFFGKPTTTNTNAGEPYSFVNFFSPDGAFTRVVFDNSNTAGTGFETDNHTISATSQTPQGDFVLVGGVAVVPEASTLTLFGGASLSFVVAMCARRRLKA